MKRLLLLALLVLPLFVKAQKIDEQKLTAQLKAIAKSSKTQFKDILGPVKKKDGDFVQYASKVQLPYTIDSVTTITLQDGMNNYDATFTSDAGDIIGVLDKIILNTDFGWGKMVPAVSGADGINDYAPQKYYDAENFTTKKGGLYISINARRTPAFITISTL